MKKTMFTAEKKGDNILMDNQSNGTDRSLSFGKMVAVIVGTTIGGGIFTTAGDMAASGAHTASVLIGWLVAGLGMLCLMMCFFGLNKYRPELTNGIYSYAKEGFGEFMGFNSAWGYWLSAIFAQTSYFTLLFGTASYFIPAFGEGNNILSIICGTVIIWVLYALILRGVKSAAAVNVVTTICKLVPIFVFIVALIFVRAFDPAVFMHNFWGDGSMSLFEQVKATNGTTVWCFIGVEGAVVLSGRARKSSDVGKASMTGFLGVLAIYIMIAVLSMGVMPAEEMAQLSNPQMGGILASAVGPWGIVLINAGLMISLLGGLLGWTIIAADCPFSAAQQGVFMKIFAKTNEKDAPVFSVLVTQILTNLTLIILYFSTSTYSFFYNISAEMIMIPYLFSAAYFLKLCLSREKKLDTGMQQVKNLFFAIVGTVYSFWMLYSSGITMVLLSTILYAPGIIIYVLGKRERKEAAFARRYELLLAVGLVVLAVVSVALLATGVVSI